MQEQLNAMKLDSLRALAKSHGVSGYATMRKAELVAALEGVAALSAKTEELSEKKTVSGKKTSSKEKTVASKKEAAEGSEAGESSKAAKTSKTKSASKEESPSSKTDSPKGTKAAETKKSQKEEAPSEGKKPSQEATASDAKKSSKKTSKEAAASESGAKGKKAVKEAVTKESDSSEKEVTGEKTSSRKKKGSEETASKRKTASKKKEGTEEVLTPIEEALKEKESRKEPATPTKASKKEKNAPASEQEPAKASETSSKAGDAASKVAEASSKTESSSKKETVSSEEAPLPAADDSEIPAPEEHRPQRTLPKPNTHGKLDIMASGYGFIRSINPETGVKRDVYIANSFIRKFNLKTGDIITGNSHPTSRFDAIFYITAINGISPMDLMTGKKAAPSGENESAHTEDSSESTSEQTKETDSKEGSSGSVSNERIKEEAPLKPFYSSVEEPKKDSSEERITDGEEDRREENDSKPVYSEEDSEYSEREENGYASAGYQQNGNQSGEYHSNIETREIEGVYELMPDGYGFLRCNNYIPGDQDIFVSPPTIRRFNLKAGDYLKGVARVTERFDALIKIYSINDLEVDSEDQVRAFRNRIPFENMTPIFPNERIHLENPSSPQIATRIIDLFSPIGKGQRGMIVSPPKAGKTTLLKQIARSIQANHPEIHLIVLLIDERPEEVTDMKESIGQTNSEVVYSTFDKEPENHCRISEMVIERAKRLVEAGKDVVILLDSITRLARAYNLVCDPSGRTLSGGLDPTALLMPKRFFGAARNMREGGSLTILATALVDTGSRMDDVVFEEFKGTGNMEIVLDRALSERRIFPAIDILKSGTRREDLLLTNVEAAAMNVIRKSTNVARQEEAVEHILQMFSRTDTNRDFLIALNQMYKRGSLS